jgi:chloride channel 3/4/5
MSDVQIREQGFPFLENLDHDTRIVGLTAVESMTPSERLVILYKSGTTLHEIETILEETHFRGFPVIESDSDDTFVGYISRNDLNHVLFKAKETHITEPVADHSSPEKVYISERELQPFINQTPLQLDPGVTLDLIVDIFKKLGPRYVCIVEGGRLYGLITKKDLLLFLETIPKSFQLDALEDQLPLLTI